MNQNKIKCFFAFISLTFLSAAVVLCRTTFQVSKFKACPPQDSKFRTLVERSVEQCVEECVRRKSCKVVGYKNLIRLCELHMYSSSSDVADNHCILIKSEDMSGPPQKYTCGEWQVSDVIAGVEHCTVKECRLQSPLKNGKFLGNKNEVGSKKAIMCNHGYIEENKPKSIECLKEGFWSHNASCVLTDCGKVPNIENGRVSTDIPGNTTFGSTATVSCVNRYETNTSSISCPATGSWPYPVCSPRDCSGVPPIGTNTKTLYTSAQTTYQSTASVKCSVRYETENTTITCLDTGQCVLKSPGNNGTLQLEVTLRLQIYTENKKQSEAAAICECELDGRLVVLDEEWKMSAVSNILSSCSDYKAYNNYWTDGKCSYNGNYQCHFTGGYNMPMNQTTMWNTGSPDDSASGCVRVWKKQGVYRWNDRNCDIKFRFICEY